MKVYDAVIIGSGIGGLTVAGLLTARGLKTLVLEKEPTPGGYLASFRRDGFVFDAAVDCIAGVTGNGLIRQVLDMLGVAGNIEFVKVAPIRTSIFPEQTVEVAANLESYVDHLSELFPCERSGIKSFSLRAEKIYDQLLSTVLSTISGDNRIGTLSSETISYMDRSYADFLSEHIGDKQLKAMLSDRCPFIGLPPSRVSAAAMIAMIMSYFKLGAYRSYGGFQVLSDRLVEGIRAKGGEVFFGRRVERILMSRDGLCQGVRCENGETYMADNVVSNADYARTFTTLLGDAYSAIPDAMNRAAGVSTSFFVVYAGINGDVPLPSSVGHFPSYDMESFFRPEMELCEDSTIGLTIASIEDPARAPHGCHTVVLHEMMKKKLCARDREQYTELVLNKAEKIIPGISGRICTIETATPQTFERYTDNNRGAAFGWQQVPGFRGTKRYGIRNLHIAGHWGDFGGGVLGAAYSGAKAASTILSRKGIPHAL